MDRMDLLSLCRDGIFSAADARAAGIDGSELRRLTGAGPACHRLLRGWYAVERPADDPPAGTGLRRPARREGQ